MATGMLLQFSKKIIYIYVYYEFYTTLMPIPWSIGERIFYLDFSSFRADLTLPWKKENTQKKIKQKTKNIGIESIWGNGQVSSHDCIKHESNPSM